jgi:hypothetical protein
MVDVVVVAVVIAVVDQHSQVQRYVRVCCRSGTPMLGGYAGHSFPSLDGLGGRSVSRQTLSLLATDSRSRLKSTQIFLEDS